MLGAYGIQRTPFRTADGSDRQRHEPYTFVRAFLQSVFHLENTKGYGCQPAVFMGTSDEHDFSRAIDPGYEKVEEREDRIRSFIST